MIRLAATPAILFVLVCGCANLGSQSGKQIVYKGDGVQATLRVAPKFIPMPTKYGSFAGHSWARYSYHGPDADMAVIIMADAGDFNFYAKPSMTVISDAPCVADYSDPQRCYTVYHQCTMARNIAIRLNPESVMLITYGEPLEKTDYPCHRWGKPGKLDDKQKSYIQTFNNRTEASFSLFIK